IEAVVSDVVAAHGDDGHVALPLLLACGRSPPSALLCSMRRMPPSRADRMPTKALIPAFVLIGLVYPLTFADTSSRSGHDRMPMLRQSGRSTRIAVPSNLTA